MVSGILFNIGSGNVAWRQEIAFENVICEMGSV